MGKSTVKIGSYEIDDAERSAPDHTGTNTLRIPCKSDPELCMQLDGWDDHTSIPALLDGQQSILYKEHYDKAGDAWVMRLES
ncbi:DUF1480 domain-containing protein [Chimaeribacter coloradensis]|uniref:DUF1480 domain-containing protein n=1 Tax=Chimaeribacter coloradensis TaxID=2060068 RepID=A0A2N5ED97_9GAMM|nr:DUF1480 family protein [Chimaeribacter coloradensis]PLR40494.1 DUF1480 domain-containing protein [Chimaeribacter coloradensis]